MGLLIRLGKSHLIMNIRDLAAYFYRLCHHAILLDISRCILPGFTDHTFHLQVQPEQVGNSFSNDLKLLGCVGFFLQYYTRKTKR